MKFMRIGPGLICLVMITGIVRGGDEKKAAPPREAQDSEHSAGDN